MHTVTTLYRSAVTAVFALLLVLPAHAADRLWQISESSGQVSVQGAGAVQIGKRGLALQQGDTVTTGPDSRAVIVRGGEFVMISPNSRIRIAKPKESGTVMQVFQYLGSALFKIEKKETPHFGVKTPYLAAVVKGTTFNVTVTENGATIQVTEGRVQVSTLDGGATDMIVPGRIARVDANDRQLLKVLGTEGKDIRSNLPAVRNDPSPADSSGAAPNGKVSNTDADSNSIAINEINTPNLADGDNNDDFNSKISAPINGDPVDIALVTGGLISGTKETDRVTDRPNPDMPSNANAGGNTDNPGNANAGGNADSPGNANAGGNADSPGNANAGGNADNPGNANAGGYADSPGNANAGGNADSPGNANAGGNADSPGNANAGGNADNPGNANAGGDADKPGNVDDKGNAGKSGGILDGVDRVIDGIKTKNR